MTSVERVKKLASKKKICTLGITILVVFILILGIRSAYAYYNGKNTFKLLSGLVGDFDNGYGDINIMIYRENEKGSYTRIYGIPEMGYVFEDKLTNCTIHCSNVDTNPDASCHYSYNSAEPTAKAFALTSNEKVTCKFYFKKATDADIKVFIMKEDENGSESYVDSQSVTRKYNLVEEVPAYGYEYSNNYYCEKEGATLTYDSNARKFTVATRTKNVCYAYFNKSGDADAIVKVHVQSTPGSTVYREVSSIPMGKTYELSKNPNNASKCFKDDGAETGVIPTYEDGYINVAGLNQKQTCHVYLDIVG